MSVAIRRSLFCALLFAGCASGGAVIDDAHKQNDAPPNIHHDAPLQTDALITDGGVADAKIFMDAPPPIDAGNPLFCSDNTMCVVAGTCCFIAACVPGTAVGPNLCFPM